jgi:hypothetical protein
MYAGSFVMQLVEQQQQVCEKYNPDSWGAV